jgi:tight adherence protein C
MGGGFDVFSGDSSALLLGLLVFFAVGMVAFAVMALMRARGAVRRRAAGMFEEDGDGRGLRDSSKKAAQRLLEYTNKHYKASSTGEMKVLRQRLIQAGIFDARAVGFFFFARTVLALGFAVATFFMLPMVEMGNSSYFWLLVMVGGVGGYLFPSVYIDRRIRVRRDEHRSGFPDFMDLLVVCADAGLSMEAALDRVGRELADSYPSLSANIHMANLEIRAGRTMTEALDHLGDRLALDEARSFATLIQQSAELGSSITDALRVYSDDMRHKRLSRAEEKAYALPTKLAVPMMVCIFPTLFVVILLPVVVRVMTAQ